MDRSPHLRSPRLPTLFGTLLIAVAACGPQSQDETSAPMAESTPAADAPSGAPEPLETVRNFQVVDDRLASSGQIAYDQVPQIRERGYDVVINLAIADEQRNALEGFHVAQEGLSYVHIPVVWEAPTPEDVEMFFDVMKANEGRKVYVHCFANMRASAFVYLYRSLVEGVPEPEARATMNSIWDPATEPQWQALIDQVRQEYGGR